eukprot:g80984.t1
MGFFSAALRFAIFCFFVDFCVLPVFLKNLLETYLNPRIQDNIGTVEVTKPSGSSIAGLYFFHKAKFECHPELCGQTVRVVASNVALHLDFLGIARSVAMHLAALEPLSSRWALLQFSLFQASSVYIAVEGLWSHEQDLAQLNGPTLVLSGREWNSSHISPTSLVHDLMFHTMVNPPPPPHFLLVHDLMFHTMPRARPHVPHNDQPPTSTSFSAHNGQPPTSTSFSPHNGELSVFTEWSTFVLDYSTQYSTVILHISHNGQPFIHTMVNSMLHVTVNPSSFMFHTMVNAPIPQMFHTMKGVNRYSVMFHTLVDRSSALLPTVNPSCSTQLSTPMLHNCQNQSSTHCSADLVLDTMLSPFYAVVLLSLNGRPFFLHTTLNQASGEIRVYGDVQQPPAATWRLGPLVPPGRPPPGRPAAASRKSNGLWGELRQLLSDVLNGPVRLHEHDRLLLSIQNLPPHLLRLLFEEPFQWLREANITFAIEGNKEQEKVEGHIEYKMRLRWTMDFPAGQVYIYYKRVPPLNHLYFTSKMSKEIVAAVKARFEACGKGRGMSLSGQIKPHQHSLAWPDSSFHEVGHVLTLLAPQIRAALLSHASST